MQDLPGLRMKSSESPPSERKRKQKNLKRPESPEVERKKRPSPAMVLKVTRDKEGRFQKLSTDSTETKRTLPTTPPDAVALNPTPQDEVGVEPSSPITSSSNIFSFPFTPMPSSQDIASDLISGILFHSSKIHTSVLAKLNHDLMIKKRFYPLFIAYIDSYLKFNEPQPITYITMNLVMSDCLKNFGFI